LLAISYYHRKSLQKNGVVEKSTTNDLNKILKINIL
jgi:hypothetical protein